MGFEELRREYQTAGFDLGDLAEDPIQQFLRWYQDATNAGIEEPNAMVLATVSAHGVLSQRHVLLKGLLSNAGEWLAPDGAETDDRGDGGPSGHGGGFVFYTNYRSRKATELDRHGQCSILFPWTEVARQIVVTGTAERAPDSVADRYFSSRPRESQLGAWASEQSTVLNDRSELEQRFAEAETRFADTVIPRPEHWGGYLVRPTEVEFWQGGTHRLHDRLVFVQETRDESTNVWTVERRSP